MKIKGAGKNNTIWVVVGIIILALLVTGGNLPFSVTGGGITALSVSQVNIQTDDQLGQSWVIYATQDGAGQYINGYNMREEINSVATTSQKVRDEFNIKVNLLDNRVEYPISSLSKSLYILEFYKVSGFNECVSSGGFLGVKPSGTYDSYCLRKSGQGVEGSVGTPVNIFNSEVVLEKGSEIVKGTITNMGQTSINLGSVAKVRWTGNLVTGEEIPRASDQDICALFSSQQWNTISCSAFNTWEIAFNKLSVGTLNGDYNAINSLVTQANNAASVVMQSKVFKSTGGTIATTTGFAADGKLTLQLSKQLQFPTFVFTIKADWVGIVVQTGQPKIVSTSSDKFRVGGDGLIKVTTQNVGAGQGSFDVYATCNSPASSNDRTRVTLQPQQIQDVYLRVAASTQTNGNSVCQVSVQDVNDASRIVQTSVAVSWDTIIICPEGQKQVFGNLIQQCTGNKWVTITVCPEGKVADPLTFTCIDTVKECGFLGINCWSNNLFGGLFSGIGNWIIIVLVLVAVIVIAPKVLGNKK